MALTQMGERRPTYSRLVVADKPFFDPADRHVIGVLVGEGVGPEVVPAALSLLEVLSRHSSRSIDIREGGLIGYPAKALFGRSLTSEIIGFAAEIFKDNGGLFCGPGGDRFVYDLRREFDMYCKLTPLEPLPELRLAGALRPKVVAGADIVAVRENSGGVYQGRWATELDDQGGIKATHSFAYDDGMVRRILRVAFDLAARRRKRLHLVVKAGGVPSISGLWRLVAQEMAADYDVDLIEFEIDNAVYQLIANPAQFDVIVSPNMFGDVLADCGALLLASRGLSYSGNFNAKGNGVYQTGHGAARDIAGRDIANPIGQMLSLGMMLAESFDWPQADAALRKAIRTTLRQGICTADVVMPGCRVCGTQAFTEAVRGNLDALLVGHPL